MNWFFDMDKPVMRGLSSAADLLILNVLTLVCALPLFTLGPALTALAKGCLRCARDEGSAVTRSYFVCFRESFKRSLVPGLALLLCVVLLGFDYLAAVACVPFMRFGVAALGMLLLVTANYLFFLLALGRSGLAATVKEAVLLSVLHAPKTGLLLLVWIALWTLAILFIRFSAPVLLMFGLSLPGYVAAAILSPVLPSSENN